jgi:hypothetical protein
MLSRRTNIRSTDEIAACRNGPNPVTAQQSSPHYRTSGPKKLSPEKQSRFDQVCALWSAGNGVREIIEIMDLPKSTVTWIINKQGLWGQGGRSKQGKKA